MRSVGDDARIILVDDLVDWNWLERHDDMRGCSNAIREWRLVIEKDRKNELRLLATEY